jgi:hypothetical protein
VDSKDSKEMIAAGAAQFEKRFVSGYAFRHTGTACENWKPTSLIDEKFTSRSAAFPAAEAEIYFARLTARLESRAVQSMIRSKT